MQKRFEAATIKINRQVLHTIVDNQTTQFCAVTYDNAEIAQTEADFLNACDRILELRCAAPEQRKGRANTLTCTCPPAADAFIYGHRDECDYR